MRFSAGVTSRRRRQAFNTTRVVIDSQALLSSKQRMKDYAEHVYYVTRILKTALKPVVFTVVFTDEPARAVEKAVVDFLDVSYWIVLFASPFVNVAILWRSYETAQKFYRSKRPVPSSSLIAGIRDPMREISRLVGF